MPIPPLRLPALTVEQLCGGWQPRPTDRHADRFNVGDKRNRVEDSRGS